MYGYLLSIDFPCLFWIYFHCFVAMKAVVKLRPANGPRTPQELPQPHTPPVDEESAHSSHSHGQRSVCGLGLETTAKHESMKGLICMILGQVCNISTVWNLSCSHELCCHVGLSRLCRNGREWMLQRNCRNSCMIVPIHYMHQRLFQRGARHHTMAAPKSVLPPSFAWSPWPWKENMLTSSAPVSSRCLKSLAIGDQLVTCLLLAVSVTVAYNINAPKCTRQLSKYGIVAILKADLIRSISSWDLLYIIYI